MTVQIDEEPTTAGEDDQSSTLHTTIDQDHDAKRKSECERIRSLMRLWKNAARRSVHQSSDPWKRFQIHERPTKMCIRHRYSAIRKQWSEDEVQVKMHPEPFARGAMRECYRLKKLSTFSHDDWLHAQNYVVKKYIQDVDRSVLFEDVKLQMDSKLWAEEFNRHNPPKKIDIVQMCVLEFVDEPGRPLYHLEHFIEGEYIKYNSNSGFVSEVCRQTPQAFSHFTFERSGHQMIVVDIQGVGDLYTDPQIHTCQGTGYGDGNLGTRGMALFFVSHKCNDICTSMCLTEFDLSEEEIQNRNEGNMNLMTNPSTKFSVVSSSLDPCEPLVKGEDDNVMERLRKRTTSSMCSYHSRTSLDFEGEEVSDADATSGTCPSELHELDTEDFEDYQEEMNDGEDESEEKCQSVGRHVRWNSQSSSLCSTRNTRETEREEFWKEARKQSRPAGLLSQDELDHLSSLARSNHPASILGQIHLDIARYHELGRFVQVQEDADKENKENIEGKSGTDMSEKSERLNHVDYDFKSALFHLDAAQKCRNLEAVITLAQMAYGFPHDFLKDIRWEDKKLHESIENGKEEDREAIGFELMKIAAELGDRSAKLFVAEGLETGRATGENGTADWPRALEYYESVLQFDDSDEATTTLEHAAMSSSEMLERPRYMILKKMADMNREGGHGLEQHMTKAYDLYNQAAEAAMEAMKGKLANKFYQMAELCECE